MSRGKGRISRRNVIRSRSRSTKTGFQRNKKKIDETSRLVAAAAVVVVVFAIDSSRCQFASERAHVGTQHTPWCYTLFIAISPRALPVFSARIPGPSRALKVSYNIVVVVVDPESHTRARAFLHVSHLTLHRLHTGIYALCKPMYNTLRCRWSHSELVCPGRHYNHDVRAK